jgi:hypothetical protein
MITRKRNNADPVTKPSLIYRVTSAPVAPLWSDDVYNGEQITIDKLLAKETSLVFTWYMDSNKNTQADGFNVQWRLYKAENKERD